MEWAEFAAEMWAEGHSFFMYTSDSVDSLASCCRLKNEISENSFSYTLGAGGVATGSKNVMTININRLVQQTVGNMASSVSLDERLNMISKAVSIQVSKLHKYMTAHNEIMKDNLKAHMLPVYEAGFISMEKQYQTTGISGFLEGAEFLGIEPTPNEDYYRYGEAILKPIYDLNKADRTPEMMFNTEFVPKECGHRAA